ncbi:MAG: hypothetical protein IPQ18_00120 [Saprospiraceae bacterium]|nr:hypothetical protein [Saprospiraceae bacterium]
MKSIIIVLGFLLAFNAMNCCKDVENCPRFFTLPVSITPARDTYNIGDTIKIVSEFSNQLIGLNIEQKEIGTFDMHGIKWKPVISYYKLDTIIPNRDDHKPLFEGFANVHILTGVLKKEFFSNGSEQIYGEYSSISNFNYLSIYIIPIKKGSFYIEFDSDNNYGTLGFQEYPGVCDNEKLYVYYKTNEGQNTNLHYLKESPDPYWDRSRPNGYTGDIHTKDPEETGGYCFKVE